MKFEARKVAVPRPDISDSAADFLAEPIVVAVAEYLRDPQEVPAHPSLSPSIHPKSSPVRPADGAALL